MTASHTGNADDLGYRKKGFYLLCIALGQGVGILSRGPTKKAA